MSKSYEPTDHRSPRAGAGDPRQPQPLHLDKLDKRREGQLGGQHEEARRQGIARVTFAAGANLFDRQHHSRQIYWLLSGWVQLSSGHNAIFSHLTRGDLFGEKLLLRSRRVDQVAKALSPTAVIVFRKAQFLERLRRDGRFAQQVLKKLALRLERYEETIRDLVTEPTERRLALALARLAPARPATGWVPLPWNPTNPELAKIVGTTRWSISHFLNRFHRLGWVRRQNGLWLQREGLQAFLQSTAPPSSKAREESE